MTDSDKNLTDIVEAALSGSPEARQTLLNLRPDGEALLEQADTIQRTAGMIPPSESAGRIRAEFLSRVDAARRPRLAWSPLSWRARPLWQKLLVPVAATVLSFGGVAVASNDSIPGGPLYPVKMAVEQARVTTAVGDRRKALVFLRLAEERLEEMRRVAEAGDRTALDQLSRRFDNDINRTLRISTRLDAASRSRLAKRAASLQEAKIELLRDLDAAARQRAPLAYPKATPVPASPAETDIRETGDSEVESGEKASPLKKHSDKISKPDGAEKQEEVDKPGGEDKPKDDDDREDEDSKTEYKSSVEGSPEDR